jgi:hypothetical protein
LAPVPATVVMTQKFVPLNCHWQENGPAPDTATLNTAVPPLVIV